MAAGTKEQGHSALGASSCKRWMNCPGSVEAHKNAPKPPPSPYAAEGQVAHDLGEQMLKGKLNKVSLMQLVGTEMEAEGGLKEKVTEDMVEGAILYFDTIIADFNAMKAVSKPAEIKVLIEVPIKASSIDEEAWGTLDAGLARKGDTLRVYDYKFGQGVLVEAKDNEQGLQYIVGVIDTLGCEAFDTIEFVIIQPRMAHPEGRVRRWRVTKEDIARFRAEAKAAIVKTREKDAPRAAGSWCRWCNAKVDCPKMRELVAKETNADFEAASAKEAVRNLADPDTLSPEMMKKALESEEVICKWFDAIRERAQFRAEQGDAEVLKYFKIVTGRSNRAWKDEKAVIERFEDLYGDSIYKPKTLRTPADLETTIGKVAVAELSHKPEGKKTIAFITDARPATVSTAAQDFKHLEAPKPAPTENELLGDL